MKLREVLHELKKDVKQTSLLAKHGRRFIDLSKFRSYGGEIKYKKGKKHILWIGAFPPRHKNVGDHAQTVAVKRFFESEFPEYIVIRVDREQAKKNWDAVSGLSKNFNSEDIVILHSSGDFGSQHYKGSNSWHQRRREIVQMFNLSKVINLPTTAIYGPSEKDQQLLEEDSAIFSVDRFTLLLREQISLSYVNDNFSCRTEFLPDFVFYLQRPKRETKRKGALVILRSDSEAKMTGNEKMTLMELLKSEFDKVEEIDILNSKFPVVISTEDNYIEYIQDLYEQYELVVTDRMHGMILSVTTNTPCLALDSGIPHKIIAYKEFIDDAVTFTNGQVIDEALIKTARDKDVKAPDLTPFYTGFKKNFIDNYQH